MHFAECQQHLVSGTHLSGGAPTVDVANNDGRTPLLAAAQNGHHEVVTALLAANATVDLAMNDGATPLYMASQDSYNERKRTNYVPVATSDKESLREIQQGITSRQTPSVRARALAKKPQYCAGQTASVTPMLENICEDIGMSKADQSNTRQDAFGNMAIGVSTEVDINKYKGGGRDVEYLIRWRGYGSDHDTWEPKANLVEHCDDMIRAFEVERAAEARRFAACSRQTHSRLRGKQPHRHRHSKIHALHCPAARA